MRVYRYTGIPEHVAAAVRHTMRAPGYGHPAHREVAGGTGPCRSCLRTFRVGAEERILFTYQPMVAGIPAPGPVFIHADGCARHDALDLPDDFRALPTLVEAYGPDGRVLHQALAGKAPVEQALDAAFAVPGVAWAHLRNAEAGCFMARVDRLQACD